MLSILALLRDIDAGRLTLKGVYDRVGEAIERSEPTVKAFAAIDIEGARRQASVTGPLSGLPFGVKDIIDTADLPTGYGSPIYDGWQPRADASAVAMTRRAGGILLAKTRTTEFAYLHPTVTTNPRDPARTPGGSSSGSAAAVAAGMLPLAFGTQTAGSVLRPAAYCGVAAIKPSFRLLPPVGVKTFSWHLDTVGLFAATVADSAYALSAITGRELRVDTKDFGAPRIGVIRNHLWNEASDAMRGAIDGLMRRAAVRGANVMDVELSSLFAEAQEAQVIIMNFEGAEALAWEVENHGSALSPELRAAIERGRQISPSAYDAARSTANTARRKVADLFADVDILVTPAAPGVAPEGLGATGDPKFNRLWTLMGVPAVNVPGLADSAGLPLGLQVLAPFGRDRVALAAADWLERLIGRG